MRRIFRILFVIACGLLAPAFFGGCENMSVGVGFSGYSNGMGYSFGVSQGPYGTHGYSGVSIHGRL